MSRPPRLPWLGRRKKTDPELPVEAPLPLGSRSNGEHFHLPTPVERRVRDLVLKRAEWAERKLGVPRREFLAGAMGMATSLWAVKLVGCGGEPGMRADGGLDGGGADAGTRDANGPCVPGEATCDAAAACEVLDTSPFFIVDVQTHHVDPMASWRETNPRLESFFGFLPQAGCGLPDGIECLSARHYLEQIFLNSDTAVAVLSGVPAEACTSSVTSNCGNPLPNEEIAATRELVNRLAGSQRSINHAMIVPNVDLPAQLASMEQLVAEIGVGAWKCYPPWGPSGSGWFLDDPAVGIPFIEKGRELGVRLFCAHKGFPLPGFDTTHTDPRDIGVVARMFPDVTFVVYHSAYNHGASGPFDRLTEGEYSPTGPALGVNSLIRALEDNGIAPNQNVVAELGSTWNNVMSSPDEAAHVIGKLLRHVGEDNVVWGTDCIWYGSPQPQIEAFRTFRISTEFQERFGYPELTDARKAKIFGLNAARLYGIDVAARRCALSEDDLAMARRLLDHELGGRRWALAPAAGPRTRREFIRLARRLREHPG
jgi:hypothetical protein